jgi:hypothetical protein
MSIVKLVVVIAMCWIAVAISGLVYLLFSFRWAPGHFG